MSHFLHHLLLPVCYASWIQSKSTLPTSAWGMAVGSYNDSIYILAETWLIEYNIHDDLVIPHGSTFLSISATGESDYYTQVEHTVYMALDFTKKLSKLCTFDMQTKTSNVDCQDIVYVADAACLASNTEYIFVAGGRDGYTGPAIDVVQMFHISTNQWLSDIPFMVEERVQHSCVIDPSTNILYAIGGTSNIRYLSSIEHIDTDDMIQNTWSVSGSAFLMEPMGFTRAAMYKHMMFIIGGAYDEGGPWIYLDAVQILDTTTGVVSVSSEQLSYEVSDVATITVDDAIYVFGGDYYGSQLNTWMEYHFVTASPTPSDPLISTLNSIPSTTVSVTPAPTTSPTSTTSPTTATTTYSQTNINTTFPESTTSELTTFTPTTFPSDQTATNTTVYTITTKTQSTGPLSSNSDANVPIEKLHSDMGSIVILSIVLILTSIVCGSVTFLCLLWRDNKRKKNNNKVQRAVLHQMQKNQQIEQVNNVAAGEHHHNDEPLTVEGHVGNVVEGDKIHMDDQTKGYTLTDDAARM